ncbi:MAG: hypothetical protein ACREX4_20080 [Gammaproteobacteria bacterium]
MPYDSEFRSVKHRLTCLEILLLVAIALSALILVKLFVGRGSTAAGAPAATVSRVIDHVQDIKEFELKRSLSGVKSLMEEQDQRVWTSANSKQRKKALERKLTAFKSR